MTLLAEGRSAIFERGDYTYLISSCGPFDPAENEIDELSFAESLRKIAPNENIMWLRGTYVEGGPGSNNVSGQEWQADDITIKSLTPVFMPVTVMHDPRSAVGLIADTKLVLADDVSGASPQRPRIDNTLAIWKHRFPEVADEISSNYERGTMMQSQECRPAYYDCGECGARFPKLPGCAERRQWCEHLRAGEVSMGVTTARRIFGNVTFTGTGLIFGSRGVKGALTSAKLELLKDEVSELHDKAATANRDSIRRLSGSGSPASTRRNKVDIEQKDYEALVAKAGKTDELSAQVATLTETAAKVPDLEKKIETLEVEKKTSDDALSEATKKIETHDEESRQATLATDRQSKLGKGFVAKLPDTIKATLAEQAKKLSDDDWSARVDELSELVGVKSDDPGEAGEGGGDAGAGGSKDTFSREETSRTAAGSGGGNGGSGEPSRAAVGAVVGGLLRRVGPQTTKEPAAK